MPLKLNLGLSRKVGEANYGSRGASMNLEVEVDSTLVAEPARFQERVRQLFGLVRISLAEELNGHSKNNGSPVNANGAGPSTVGPAAGNGSVSPSAEKPRMATASQLKAIAAIANRQKINLTLFLQNRIGVGRPADLTLKQASQAIDELKAAVAPGG